MEHVSRIRLLTAIVLTVVFGAGVLLGLAADSSLGAEPAEVMAEETNGEAESERRSRLIYPQVHPTPDQQARIEAIVSEHRERKNALDEDTRAAYRQGFREILLETRAGIKGVFAPEQAAEYQRLLDEFDAARQATERENRDDRK